MRKSLYLVIALVCGTLATVVANQWLNAQASNTPVLKTSEVFVASAAIGIGAKITADKVRLEQWPSDKMPEGSTGDFTVFDGKYAKQRFFPGEPIMPIKLMDENWTTVPKGYSVVAMSAADVSIANLIQPGDRVDVLAYFKKSDLIPRTMTKTVLMGVRVYALDGDTQRRASEDRPRMVRNIQLLINKKDQQAWAYAGELGRIQLTLGSDADYTTEDGSNQAAAEFLTWLEEFRNAQDQARREAADRKLAETLAGANPEPEPEPKKKEEGFSMFKMSEGRMVEYWIVPGKLPVLVGEVTDAGSSINDVPGGSAASTEPVDMESDEYSYLNGEDSPFFEPESGDSAGSYDGQRGF